MSKEELVLLVDIIRARGYAVIRNSQGDLLVQRGAPLVSVAILQETDFERELEYMLTQTPINEGATT